MKWRAKKIELDKTIIEAIRDPLMHLVRNGVDHGIEPPQVRRAAGKQEEGLLFLRAFSGGGTRRRCAAQSWRWASSEWRGF